MRRVRFTLLSLCAALVLQLTLFAEEEHPLAPLDVSSPRATLRSFNKACEDAYNAVITKRKKSLSRRTARTDVHAQRVMSCLDVSELPQFIRDSRGREVIVCLKEVLDRIDLPREKDIPDAKDIAGIEVVPPPEHWTIPNTEITLSRIQEGPRKGSYVFNAATVNRAIAFYDRVKHLPYKEGATEGLLEWYLSEPGYKWIDDLVSHLPPVWRKRVGGQAVWQWLGVVITSILAVAIMLACYRVGRNLMTKGAERRPLRYGLTLFFPIVAMMVPLEARDFMYEGLNITGHALVTIKFTANIIFLMALIVTILGAGTRFGEIIIASPKIHPQGIDAQFIRLIWRMLSIVAAIIAFLEGGQNMGIPLTTLLAGAGVAGMAVALAAQDTLKNVFGSMMIFLDKPYRIGERILVKGYDGIVEEIGLRSTKIRMLTGHLTTIPNDEMARSDVENVARRPHIRRILDIPLPIDIGADKAQRAVDIVKEILDNHEGQQGDFVPRVWLSDFKRDCIILRVILWYHPAKYWDFVAFSEKLNKQIMEHFESEGIRFALPTTLSYLAQDEKHPLEVKREGERKDQGSSVKGGERG